VKSQLTQLRLLLILILVLLAIVAGYFLLRLSPNKSAQLDNNPQPNQPPPPAHFSPDRLDPSGPIQMLVNADNNDVVWIVRGRLVTPLRPSGDMLRSQS
jgi:hypothetical protein